MVLKTGNVAASLGEKAVSGECTYIGSDTIYRNLSKGVFLGGNKEPSWNASLIGDRGLLRGLMLN